MPNDAVVEAALATNHERIWLQPLCCIEDRCWCQDPQPCEDCGLPAIEYVRADLAAAISPSDLAQVKAALEVFAEASAFFGQLYLDGDTISYFERKGGEEVRITVGDLRRAIEALAILERAGVR